MTHPPGEVAAVLIGRNEGARLVTALAAATRDLARVVYVDSGSTDGSVAAARHAGAEVVELDMSVPFTAARARNAGSAALDAAGRPDFVQFIDGDCELREGWIKTALNFLRGAPKVAIVTGRVRERHPEASLWNRLCDREWDLPLGDTPVCGGIFMVRADRFADMGGFNPDLIAGEEPELCLRLRLAGHQIWRLADEMVWHDSGMTRIGQWLTRARRAGYTYAEGVWMHGRSTAERYNVAPLRRALLWGIALPLTVVLGGLFVSPWIWGGLLFYPLQMARVAQDDGDWLRAACLSLSKFAEAGGALGFYLDLARGKRRGLIEYK